MRVPRAQTTRLGIASAVGSKRGGALKVRVRSQAEGHRSRASL